MRDSVQSITSTYSGQESKIVYWWEGVNLSQMIRTFREQESTSVCPCDKGHGRFMRYLRSESPRSNHPVTNIPHIWWGRSTFVIWSHAKKKKIARHLPTEARRDWAIQSRICKTRQCNGHQVRVTKTTVKIIWDSYRLKHRHPSWAIQSKMAEVSGSACHHKMISESYILQHRDWAIHSKRSASFAMFAWARKRNSELEWQL